MTNQQYGGLLIIVLLAVPLLVLQVVIGFAWWLVLMNFALLTGWVSIVWRERQRRMRERAVRREQRRSPLAPKTQQPRA
jgi:membrane protein implicated in regulation of membrane protease activity